MLQDSYLTSSSSSSNCCHQFTKKKKKKQKVTCSSSSFAFCQHNFRIFSLSPSVNISKMRETDSGFCNCFSYFLTTVDGFFLVHLMLRADIAEKEVSKIGQLIASLFFGRSRFITPHAPLSRIFYVCLCKKQVCLPSYFFAFIRMISKGKQQLRILQPKRSIG